MLPSWKMRRNSLSSTDHQASELRYGKLIYLSMSLVRASTTNIFNASQYENGHAYDASGSPRNDTRRSLRVGCGRVLGAPKYSGSTKHSKRCDSRTHPAILRCRWFRLWLIPSSSGY